MSNPAFLSTLKRLMLLTYLEGAKSGVMAARMKRPRGSPRGRRKQITVEQALALVAFVERARQRGMTKRAALEAARVRFPSHRRGLAAGHVDGARTLQRRYAQACTLLDVEWGPEWPEAIEAEVLRERLVRSGLAGRVTDPVLAELAARPALLPEDPALPRRRDK